MSFSIYDLDERIRKLIDLDNFLNGLSVNEFIEELSKDHILKEAEVNKLGYLDPKPYIRTFESTLRELKNLAEQSKSEQEHCERVVEDIELKHSENVLQLSSKIDRTTQKFDVLDDKISEVTSKINPLGSSLNKITNSRDRSLETIFLIRSYHGFYTKEKYDPLETLRKSNAFEDKVKCAKTVANLLILAKKIESQDIPKTTKCLGVIEKYGEMMERSLLNRFEVASDENQFGIMKEVADILFQFNGGSNVVQTFVSKNDLLLEADLPDSEEEDSILDDEAAWVKLADPNFVGIIKDVPTEALLDRLKVSIKTQARIVKQVFDEPVPVLEIFIQRMFAQMIQNKVSTLLQYSLSVSLLAHVRVLHYLYTRVGDFTRDVKDFISNNDLDVENELANILDQSYNDLFIDYTSDNVYFSREKKNLEDIIYDIVHKFNIYNEKASSSGVLATKVDNLDSLDYNEKGNQTSQDRFSFHFSEKRRLNQFKSFVKAKLKDKRSSIEAEKPGDEYGELNISMVETTLKSAIESIARLLELAPNKSPEYALEILEIILFDFGKLYIGGGLEVAYDSLKQETSKMNTNVPLNVSYMKIFTTLSEILFLISSTIKKIIIPCAINAPNIKNRMSNLTNGYIVQCERSLNVILQETLDLVDGRIAYFLTKQKKKDFMCETIEDDTESCELISEFLVDIHDKFQLVLNNKNLNNVLIKLGMNFLNQLLQHYKKFNVNSTGGIVLTKDVLRYQFIINEWGIEDLSENFQLLKEISNLFTVQTDLIGSLVSEGHLAKLKGYQIKQYVSKRADFNPGYIERLFNFKN